MKGNRITIIVSICMVLGVMAVIASGVMHSSQARMGMPLPITLEEAEFSIDGGKTWQEAEDSALRKQKGDISIRGHFNLNTHDGWMLNLFLQHVQMEVFVNGEIIGSFAAEFQSIRPEWCAELWTAVRFPDTTTEDLIEFRFHTFHRFGIKAGVYEKCLSTMRASEPFMFYQWITQRLRAEQIFGLTLMIVGLVLLGIAFAALLMKSPLQRIMMYTALLAIGEGLFWLANASEIVHYVNGSIAFFNLGRFVSRMVSVYAMFACMTETITGRGKPYAQWVTIVSGMVSFVFLALQFTGVMAFCETEWIWQGIQLILLLIALAVCVNEIRQPHYSVWNHVKLISFALAYAALAADMANMFAGWYMDVQISKYVCGLVAICHAAALLVQLPASYAAIKRAEKLSEELHNSRIVLAMSQIRTHFIFNVLNAISSLCKSAPELADAELVRFSRYLRNNIDIMQEDHPIAFEKALDHMHNYVDLEQLRFEEKILLDENYEYIDFMIPSLVIQPLVENAIKHGLLPKEEGGVLRVSTRRCGNEVVIEIADNGVGFDTNKEIAKTSVGLSNVRFRVERMMGGRLHIESTPGKGTVVQVWLPLGKDGAKCT